MYTIYYKNNYFLRNKLYLLEDLLDGKVKTMLLK